MRSSVAKKYLRGLVAFTSILTICFCLVTLHETRARLISEYGELGSITARALSGMIDADRVLGYLDSKQPDSYYSKTLSELRSLRTYGVVNASVVIPNGKSLTYIWDMETPAKDALGMQKPCDDKSAAWYKDRFRADWADVTRGPEALLFETTSQHGVCATSAAPVLDHERKPVALVIVSFSVEDMLDTLSGVVLNNALFFVLIFALYIAASYGYAKRYIIQPIRQLTQAANGMTQSLDKGVSYSSNIHTGDEVEALSLSFEQMSKDLRTYVDNNMRMCAEKERLDTELSMAARIQSSQLPQQVPAFPEHGEFDVCAVMRPAKEVGGDFYDYFLVDDDHLALVVADVSGKGMPAALFMMAARNLLKEHAQEGETPAQVLNAVNRRLVMDNDAALFVTVWLCVLELSTGRCVEANAGHGYPALCRKGAQYQIMEYPPSTALGLWDDAEFDEHEFVLHPGDALFAYTDGVTEAKSSANKLFGAKNMLLVLNKELDASPERVLGDVLDAIASFAAGAEQFDDITALCVRYNGGRAG